MRTIKGGGPILAVFVVFMALSCGGRTGNREEAPSDPAGLQDGSGEASERSPGPGSAMQPEGPDHGAEMALQDAALNGQFEMAEGLVRRGVNVNAADQEGRTALMYASFNGHTEIVRMLLESGAETGLRDVAGRTALLYASTGPFPETVKLLLENNADPNIADAQEAFTPLMHAASEGHLEVVRILLEHGADPSKRDVDGDNARAFAVQNGHTEVAEYLERK